MISWTESVSLTALTSSQTASSSFSYTRPLQDAATRPASSNSASFAATTSANASGETYITKTWTAKTGIDRFYQGSVDNSSRLFSYSSCETLFPNGARTTTSASFQTELFTVDDTPLPSVSTETESGATTISNSSASATRSSQTTTQTTALANSSITTTISASTTLGTTTHGFPTSLTIPTIQLATTERIASAITQSTRSVTQATTTPSTYTSYAFASGAYAGLGRITKILPESGEVVWVIKSSQDTDTTGQLSALADSYTSSFVVSAASQITVRPTSAYDPFLQDPATLFFSVEITEGGIAETSTVSDQPFTTFTLYSFSSGGGFPLVSYTEAQTSRTQSTATIQTYKNSSSFVFGSSTTMAAVGTSTMTAKHGGLVHQLSYATTTTASRWTDGLALSSYSTTYFGDGGEATEESYTEELSQGATIEGVGLSYGIIPVGFNNPARDIESSYRSGWASPAAITSAAEKIGLEPNIYALAPNSILGRAFPRVISPFPATTVSLGISTRGSSTWSYGPAGVSRTSISTGTTATAETTSASWTKEGNAITEQGDFFGVLTPTTSFISTNNVVRRFGGKPAVGSNITAIIAPGKYFTASGSVSGTARYSTPQALAGTAQTVFLAQPDYVVASINANAAQGATQPPQLFSHVRNPLPYSSTFFPI